MKKGKIIGISLLALALAGLAACSNNDAGDSGEVVPPPDVAEVEDSQLHLAD